MLNEKEKARHLQAITAEQALDISQERMKIELKLEAARLSGGNLANAQALYNWFTNQPVVPASKLVKANS